MKAEFELLIDQNSHPYIRVKHYHKLTDLEQQILGVFVEQSKVKGLKIERVGTYSSQTPGDLWFEDHRIVWGTDDLPKDGPDDSQKLRELRENTRQLLIRDSNVHDIFLWLLGRNGSLRTSPDHAPFAWRADLRTKLRDIGFDLAPDQFKVRS